MRALSSIILLVVASYNLNILGQEAFLEISAHTDKINTIEFSQDGKYLASCSDDKSLKVWDASDGST